MMDVIRLFQGDKGARVYKQTAHALFRAVVVNRASPATRADGGAPEPPPRRPRSLRDHPHHGDPSLPPLNLETAAPFFACFSHPKAKSFAA
jgi:hypothetical protein